MQRTRKELKARWKVFHKANPDVEEQLIELAREARDEGGFEHYSINALFEVIRWKRTVERRDNSGFKLDNNHRHYYSVHIMKKNPDLKGFFHTRAQARTEQVQGPNEA